MLLNWGDAPVKDLTVTVPAAGRFRKVSSVERGPLAGVADGDAVTVTLPLEHVDVLLVE